MGHRLKMYAVSAIFRLLNDNRRLTTMKLRADAWEKILTRITTEAMEKFMVLVFSSCDL